MASDKVECAFTLAAYALLVPLWALIVAALLCAPFVEAAHA